ncbi:MAG TPA: NAD(P)-dependent oxidoreductase, partial [Phycicoccus sp.]|nr:NAD(P)-dependent oxidoreductase [Phycicoccus sp.]
ADLDQVLAQADILSLHAVVTGETREMINRETIARTEDGVLIVNTARGALIHSDYLAEALRSGKVAGAAVDVYDPEPPAPDHPLLGLPNVIVWGVAAAVLARTSSLVLSVTVAVVAAVWTVLVVLLEIVPVGRIGASLGRLLLGVRIIDARAGTTIGVGRAIVRRLVWALMAVPCYLGFISYVTDSSGYHRAWHDKAAGCVAVAAPRVPFGAAIRAVVGTLKP